MSKTHMRYRIGPLYADSEAVAHALLCDLVEAIPAEDKKMPVLIHVPQPNQKANRLVSKQVSQWFEILFLSRGEN